MPNEATGTNGSVGEDRDNVSYDEIPLPSFTGVRRKRLGVRSIGPLMTFYVAGSFLILGAYMIIQSSGSITREFNAPTRLSIAVASWFTALIIANAKLFGRGNKKSAEQSPRSENSETPVPPAPRVARVTFSPDIDSENIEGDRFASFSYWVKQNQAFISNYHDLAQQQARNSFRNSQIAMSTGLIILVVGVAVTISSNTTEVKLLFGGITALSSTFSGYVGATFLRAHYRALDQLNYYYGQPVVTNYLLAAERVARTLENDRDIVLRSVVEQALEGAKRASVAAHEGDAKKGHNQTNISATRSPARRKRAPSTRNSKEEPAS